MVFICSGLQLAEKDILLRLLFALQQTLIPLALVVQRRDVRYSYANTTFQQEIKDLSLTGAEYIIEEIEI